MITLFSPVKRFFSFRAVLLLMFAFSAASAWATNYITEVKLIGGSKSTVETLKSTYTSQGWSVVNKDLNAGCGSESDYVYLLYKTDSSNGINCGYITDFYITDIKSPNSTLSANGRNYQIVPCDGDEHFKNSQGDLNSNAGGEYIHLFFTRDLKDNKAITGISFNDNQSGAVGLKGGSEGYDLNKGCGSESDYIYMHVTTATATVPTLSGSGTSSDPFVINNSNDWIAFASNIYYGQNTDKYYKLSNSYSDETSITKMVGTDSNPFRGTLDGNGKTVSFQIKSTSQGAAPFHKVSGATIQNLNVKGTSEGASYTAGLVGICEQNSGNVVKGCNVEVSVAGSPYVGGIVGHGGHGALTIEDCTYKALIANYLNSAGGLMGMCNELTLTINNSFFNGQFQPLTGAKHHPIALKDESKTVVTNISNAYYINTAFPSDGLGGNAIPELKGTPVSKDLVPGNWETEVTINGQTYYALTVPKTLPYEYGFEFGMCDWTTQNADANTGITTKTKASGEYSFSFAQSSQDQYLISPELKTLSALETKFLIRGEGSFSIQLGYSTTTSDLSAFSWGETMLVNGSTWFIITGKGLSATKYFAIKSISGNAAFVVDDIELAEYPEPQNITYDIKDRSVTFNWECPNDNVLGYFWKIKRADSENEWIDSNSINDKDETSVTITGLEPSTRYQFYIQSLFPGGRTSDFWVITFTTQRPMAYLPYFEGFEDDLVGWNTVNADAQTGVKAAAKHEGDYGYYFNKTDHLQYLQSPLFEADKLIKVSFYYKNVTSGRKAYFITAYSTNGSVTNDNILDRVTVSSREWERYETILPFGTRFFYLIWANSDSYNGDILYVDDFSFTEPLALTFPKEGYLTFYDGNRNLVLPKGMKARLVSGVDADGVLIYETVADGYVGTDESEKAEDYVESNRLYRIPVILQVAPSDSEQTFYVDYTIPAIAPGGSRPNLLHGSDAETTTFGGEVYYKLGRNDSNDLGWVYGASNGAAFTAQPHEAWLALKSVVAQGHNFFELFDFDQPTGIKDLEEHKESNGNIYNLSGQRLQKVQKGINIINGKKILIK